MGLIGNVKRLTMDLRFLGTGERFDRFKSELGNLLKKYNITIQKENCGDITQKYENEVITDKCPHCQAEVRVYLIKSSYCMNCGKVIYPCSLCNTCTDECKNYGGLPND